MDSWFRVLKRCNYLLFVYCVHCYYTNISFTWRGVLQMQSFFNAQARTYIDMYIHAWQLKLRFSALYLLDHSGYCHWIKEIFTFMLACKNTYLFNSPNSFIYVRMRVGNHLVWLSPQWHDKRKRHIPTQLSSTSFFSPFIRIQLRFSFISLFDSMNIHATLFS